MPQPTRAKRRIVRPAMTRKKIGHDCDSLLDRREPRDCVQLDSTNTNTTIDHSSGRTSLLPQDATPLSGTGELPPAAVDCQALLFATVSMEEADIFDSQANPGNGAKRIEVRLC